MSVFEAPDLDEHEEVHFANDRGSGLRVIVAIHSTRRGPSLGGCRMWPYQSESEAIRDVLRLSRGMTYKAAMANVRLGGGKSIIWGDSRTQKTPALMQAMGGFIQRLGGRYIVGEDIGTNPDDMKVLRSRTQYVTCLRAEDGGYGDPAPITALGVLSAMRAAVQHRLGRSDLQGIRVAVQGVGNVGKELCRLLAGEGASLIVCDVHQPAVMEITRSLGALFVPPDRIYDAAADVFSPCAMGAILNDDTIGRLNVKIVAGAANNQLQNERHAEALKDAGITYVPDYVANGGGLISCAAEWYRESPDQVRGRVLRIRDTTMELLERARSMGMQTSRVADLIARERLDQ